MRYKIALVLFVLSLRGTTTWAQSHFAEAKICHNKGWLLSDIGIGKYQIKFQNGELASLSSKDEVVSYEAGNKRFIVSSVLAPHKLDSFLKVV